MHNKILIFSRAVILLKETIYRTSRLKHVFVVLINSYFQLSNNYYGTLYPGDLNIFIMRFAISYYVYMYDVTGHPFLGVFRVLFKTNGKQGTLSSTVKRRKLPLFGYITKRINIFKTFLQCTLGSKRRRDRNGNNWLDNIQERTKQMLPTLLRTAEDRHSWRMSYYTRRVYSCL